jgi:sulfite oxidase
MLGARNLIRSLRPIVSSQILPKCNFSAHSRWNSDSLNGKFRQFATWTLAGATVAGTAAAFWTYADAPSGPSSLWSLNNNNPRPRPDLPVFTLAELQEHVTDDTGYWVSFRGAVYDVTGFIKGHPGGEGRIQMAAGRDLEPFWKIYRLHFRGHILPFLEEKFRIGSLSPEDAKAAADFEFPDPYEDDPPRHADNSPCTHKPFCGETRLDLLTESYYTPNEIFYTRNHNNVPSITEEEYELVIEGHGMKRHVFTLKDLKTKFTQYEVVSTVQCAGNRGEDFHGMGKGPSKATFLAPHWAAGAISNALWKGVRIRDILEHCGLPVDDLHAEKIHMPGATHLLMESYDCDETGEAYGASTYMDKVLDVNGDAIIAFEMNGKPLPRDHGYPARVILPGHAGARQPKWIHRLEVTGTPYIVMQCLNFSQDVTFEKDLSDWPPKMMSTHERQTMVVQQMPVQSLVCYPPQNAVFGVARDAQSLAVKGVAWSGGGAGIKRVEVSLDGGSNFISSSLYKPVEQKRRCEWGWTQFFQTVPLSPEHQAALRRGEPVELEIVSKAVDSSFNVQPERPEPYVNPRGTAVNHWYRVKVTLDPRLPSGSVYNPAAEASAKGLFANTPSGGSFKTPFAEGGWSNAPMGGETPHDWHKYSTEKNVQGEPGIESKIDWEYYRNLHAPPYYAHAKIVR